MSMFYTQAPSLKLVGEIMSEIIYYSNIAILPITFFLWRYALKTWLTRKIESNIELSKDKAILELKQRFDLTVFNKGLYYEQQKEAYTEILTELSQVSKAIADNLDSENNVFQAIDHDIANDFWMAVERNLLFFDDDVYQTLNICSEVANKTCTPIIPGIPDPSSLEIRDSLRDLSFLQIMLGKLLRHKIGLSENPKIESKIAIIGISNLISDYTLKDLPITNISEFERNKFATVEEMIEIIESRREELLDILTEIIEYISDEGNVYFHLIPRLNFFLEKL